VLGQVYIDPTLSTRRLETVCGDGTPPHYALRVRQYLDQTFPDRWISRRGAIEWPPRSPDVSPLDLFMCEDLRQRIVNECLQITPQILQNVRQRFEQNLLKIKVKFPASIMVWGIMSSKGVGKLHFIDGNVDTNKYLAILEESLLPVMEECLTSGQDFVFQQDGAACRTSKKAIKWIEENNEPLFKWVSSSPDLSPIETLWHEMKKP
ncbi:unnamed protein product, partial [Acanthoscelides obtectus]